MLDDVIYELLNELGMSVSNENYIILQNGTVLKFNGKDIRFSYKDRFMIDGKKEVWFDPVNNSEMIKNLYNHYTITHYHDTGNKIISTVEEQEKTSFKLRLHISYTDSSNDKCEMNTQYYNNINIGYIQIMLRNVMDVTSLDNK